MGPGHVLVEADANEGETVQRGAGHVVFAGQSQVGLVPGAGAEPGLVRVAEEHAAAVDGGLAAEGKAVAAAIDIAQFGRRGADGLAGALEVFRADIRRHGVGAGHREQRAAEEALVRAAAQGLPAQVVEIVDHVEGVDPVGTATAEVAFREVVDAGLVEVAVHTRGKAAREVPGELRQRVDELGLEGLSVTVQVGEQEVGIDAAHVLAHERRRLARGEHDLAHGHAEVVLGVGVAETVAEALPVIGLDVRDAVLGTADLGAERGRRFGRRGLRRGRNSGVVAVATGGDGEGK